MASSATESTVSPIDAPNRLAHFRCVQPLQGYPVDYQWISANKKYHSTSDFNVAAVLKNERSYELFVSQMRGYNVVFPNGDVFLCGGNGRGIVQINGSTADNYRADVHRVGPTHARFVFTPSFSRYQPGRSQYLEALGVRLDFCKNTVGVLMVRADEFALYHQRFAKEWFVMAPVHVPCDEHRLGCNEQGCELTRGGYCATLAFARLQHTPQATIGQARHSIMNVARSWDLRQIWMIDDSVPVEYLRTCITSPVHQQDISIMDALEEVETFALTNSAGEGDAGPLALVGIPSTFSVEKSSTFDPQWNHRAATSFVCVNLFEIYKSTVDRTLNYDPRLLYKEDVIFSARLIKAGRSVCIYRKIHFQDKTLPGGCQQYRQV